ncbi:MAG: rRNA pseudouridine synthase [Oscillospiraceae bacterium]|jgi:23S rRNA pseudouridine2605 synthase|nr:rRNA pseudouridine synthase [Oscillospiraceae bacterium]
MKERLSKVLAAHGVASRRGAETLIESGRVKVNGQTAVIGQKVDIESDAIEVSGRPLRPCPEPMTILLHKPRGVVTTLSDEKGRRTVRDVVSEIDTRLVPVGRLDINTEGLLLMSNDGALVHRITHPSHEIEKEYHVWVTGPVDAAKLILAEPMTIEGHTVKPVRAALVERREDGGVLALVIHEGRHHQVRLMCEQAGLTVKRLARVRLGFLTLQGVPYGKWRKLTPLEVKKLKQ